MNFEIFNHYYNEAHYDEIKVIGREVQKEGKPYHIIGMTLKKSSLVCIGTYQGTLRNGTLEGKDTKRVFERKYGVGSKQQFLYAYQGI